MSIWNNNPVGFAAQNQIGPGITVKPIDIRPFLDDPSRGGRSASGKAKDASLKNKDILPGSNTALNKYSDYIDSQISGLTAKYTNLFANNTDEKQVDKLRTDYAQEMNDLTTEKSNISVQDQNAQMAFNNHKAVNTTIETKEIGHEVAITDPLVGDATTGDALLRIENPFAMSISKDGNGRYSGKLHTYNEVQEDAYNNSGIIFDDAGRLKKVTDYKAPVTNVVNSLAFDDYVHTNMKEAATNMITTERNGDNMKSSFDQSYGTNQSNTTDALNNMFNTLPSDVRAYAITTSLKNGIVYSTGKQRQSKDNMGKMAVDKHGKPIMEDVLSGINGEDAMLIIQKNRYDASKLGNTIEDAQKKQQLMDENKRLANGIITTAKQYVYHTALNDVPGLLKITDSYKTGISELAKEEKDNTPMSHFDAIYGKLTNATTNSISMQNVQTGDINNTKGVGFRSYGLNLSDASDLAQSFMNKKDGQFVPIPIIDAGMGMMNGIAFKPNVIFNGDKNAKIIGVNPELVETVEFNHQPSEVGGWQLGTPNLVDKNTPYTTKYLSMRAQASGHTKIPVMIKGKKAELMELNKIPAEMYLGLGIVKSENNYTKDNVYQFNMFVPAPSSDATNGTNTVNAYNKDRTINNVARGNTTSFGHEMILNNIQKTNQAHLEQLKQNDPTRNYIIHRTNGSETVYSGKNIDEQYQDIKNKNNLLIDNRSVNKDEKDRDVMRNILYNLEKSESISHEDYLSLIDKMNKDLIKMY